MARIINSTQRRIISSVFKTLADEGILTFKGRMCYRGCSTAKLNEIERIKKLTPTGYAWYHQQDIEQLNITNQLYIGFDGKDSAPLNAVEVGARIATLFNKVGCSIDWDKTDKQKIKVTFYTPRKKNANNI